MPDLNLPTHPRATLILDSGESLVHRLTQQAGASQGDMGEDGQGQVDQVGVSEDAVGAGHDCLRWGVAANYTHPSEGDQKSLLYKRFF